jgi:ERCC4-type nuclease
MIKLEIDYREHQLIAVLHNLRVQIVKTNLDVGDIRISYNDSVICIIERKTLQDLYASIKDGRYKEQKDRLLDVYHRDKIMYIIEGSIYHNHSNDNIRGAFINTLVRDNIKIVNTSDLQETALLLRDMITRMMKHPDKYLHSETNKNNQQNITGIQCHTKKSYITPETFAINALSQIPGVSTSMSRNILSYYENSLKTFIDTATEDVIANIKLDSGRRVGDKTAKQIMEFVSFS